MKKWLVYKCSNSPVERKDGYMYDSNYEASFDTWLEAEEYIARQLFLKQISENDNSIAQDIPHA